MSHFHQVFLTDSKLVLKFLDCQNEEDVDVCIEIWESLYPPFFFLSHFAWMTWRVTRMSNRVKRVSRLRRINLMICDKQMTLSFGREISPFIWINITDIPVMKLTQKCNLKRHQRHHFCRRISLWLQYRNKQRLGNETWQTLLSQRRLRGKYLEVH